MPPVVADARAYLGHSLAEVQQALGPGMESVPGDEYGRMRDVTSVSNAMVYPGTIYLLGDSVELVYLSGDALPGLSRSSLAAHFGDDAVRLRSRAGKRANLFVHAEQGVAWSERGEELHFVEVFRPRTQAAYVAEIYRDPGPFIR